MKVDLILLSPDKNIPCSFHNYIYPKLIKKEKQDFASLFLTSFIVAGFNYSLPSTSLKSSIKPDMTVLMI
jgi:hypothetical protein